MLALGDQFLVRIVLREEDGHARGIGHDVIIGQHIPSRHVDERSRAARNADAAIGGLHRVRDPDRRLEHLLVNLFAREGGFRVGRRCD